MGVNGAVVVQMNGRQALRMLLLEDWNSQEGKNFTPRDLKRVMTALNLKQGVMTANQVCYVTTHVLQSPSAPCDARKRVLECPGIILFRVSS